MTKANFFAPEMRHDVIETPIFLWLARVINLCVMIMVTILLIDFVYFKFIKDLITRRNESTNDARIRMAKNKQMQSRGGNEIWYKIQVGVTWIFIFCSFFASLIECINIWSVVDDIENYDCQLIMTVYLIFYLTSKTSLYCIFILSAYICFYGSTFEYSKKFLISLLIIVVIFGAFVISSSDVAIEGVWVIEPVIWCHIHIRVCEFLILVFFVFCFFSFCPSCAVD